MTLTVGSLFSGIGGLELGLERAGMKTVWQVECDPYAQKVLAKHWPGILRRDDVRKVHARVPANEFDHPCEDCLPRVDLICGGFPCQDISNAGKRAGIDGERSGLWGEFHRLIREIRPRFVLVENVAALLVRGLDRVLGDLAASGYDAEWDCIPAAAVGAPHRRDRLFVVAYAQRDALRLQSERHQREGRGVRAAQRGNAVAVDDGAQGIMADAARLSEREQAIEAHAVSGRREAWSVFGGGSKPSRADAWASESGVRRVVDGLPAELDEARLTCLGNAVVPQVAEFIGRRILEVAA